MGLYQIVRHALSTSKQRNAPAHGARIALSCRALSSSALGVERAAPGGVVVGEETRAAVRAVAIGLRRGGGRGLGDEERAAIRVPSSTARVLVEDELVDFCHVRVSYRSLDRRECTRTVPRLIDGGGAGRYLAAIHVGAKENCEGKKSEEKNGKWVMKHLP